MTEHDNSDRSYLEDSASEMSHEEGILGRYGAGRHRDYSNYAGRASHGYGGHRATRGEDLTHLPDDDSLAGENSGFRCRGASGHRGIVREDDDTFDHDSSAEDFAGRGLGGNRRCHGMGGEDYEEFSDDDSLAGDSIGRRYGGARGQLGHKSL